MSDQNSCSEVHGKTMALPALKVRQDEVGQEAVRKMQTAITVAKGWHLVLCFHERWSSCSESVWICKSFAFSRNENG